MMTRNVKEPLRSLDGKEYSRCDEQRAFSGGHDSAYHENMNKSPPFRISPIIIILFAYVSTGADLA